MKNVIYYGFWTEKRSACMGGKLTIYHGSQKLIQQPVYGAGNVRNDYGLGFY